MTLTIMELIGTISMMTLGIIDLITTFSIMTLGIRLNVIMLSVTFHYCHAQCNYAQCLYAECRYVECCYTKRRCACRMTLSKASYYVAIL
jgi:hypothetical protein